MNFIAKWNITETFDIWQLIYDRNVKQPMATSSNIYFFLPFYV